MSYARIWMLLGVGMSALLMIITGATVMAHAAPVAASAPAGARTIGGGDPVVVTNWAGYGVQGVGTTHSIPAMFGSWTGFTPVGTAFICPTVAYASEAIGVGLNTGGFGGRIDGVGTLVICVFGTPSYYAWVEKGSASSLVIPLPITVGPNDVFQASVTTTNWVLTDVTTAQTTSGTWTIPLPATTREAECIVGRGTSVLGLPAIFKPLPTSSPTTLSSPVYFGDAYTGTGTQGCWYLDPGNGAYYGLGAPAAGWAVDQFHLNNPPPAGSRIVPSAPATGVLAGDSFSVP
jgi:hypothetical protein